MKQRIFAVFLALTLAISGLLSFGNMAFGAVDTEPVIGDVNGDGKVTSTDYQIIKKIFAGSSFSAEVEEKADINNDGAITSTDYLIIKYIFLGIPVQITPKALEPQTAPADDGQAFSYRVSTTITDNMVLQRNQYLNIFGTAEKAGGIIYVELMGETRYAVVDSNGEWCVQMSAHPASTVPVELKVYTKAQGPENGYCFRNILLGDVWLISGQSNAQVTLTSTLINNPSFENTISEKDNIRLLHSGSGNVQTIGRMISPRIPIINTFKKSCYPSEGCTCRAYLAGQHCRKRKSFFCSRLLFCKAGCRPY